MKRLSLTVLLSVLLSGVFGCSGNPQTTAKTQVEEAAIARTEFTERIENFFEYEPLKKGKPSQFRIHLTDLSDGSPVEQADVTLTVRGRAGEAAGQIKAKVGKVTGIYVAELNIANPGNYEIEFHIMNNKLDERLPLADFKVE